MPEITVIAPVYKVEKYLDDCVRSVLAQSFTNWELILVDDGSPDGSGAICDAWAAKDSRVVALHQPNQGVSAARNAALERRRGSYVAFVDSDDTLPPDALAILHAKAEAGGWDIVTAGTRVTYPGHVRTWVCPAFEAEEPAGLLPWLDDYFFSMFAIIIPTGKLIRGDFIDAHGLRFNPALAISEDTDFFCRLFSCAQRVANLDVALYNYIKRAEHYTATSAPRLDGVENAHEIKSHITVMLRALGFERQAADYAADPARMSGYGVYFNQLNHAGLHISFGEHYRRLAALLANPAARAVVLKDLQKPPQGRDPRDPRAAAISRFLVRRRWAFWLTCFIRLKSALIRRRAGAVGEGE